MNKNTKLGLAVVGVGAIAYYLFTKKKQATTKNYAGTVGDRLGADGLLARMKKAAQPYLPQVYHPENASAGPAKKKKAFADENFLGFADNKYVNQSGAWDRFKKAVKPYLPQTMHPENAIWADPPPPKKKKAFADDNNFVGFADGGYVNKGDMYNNNLRFGTGWIGNKKSMTGAPTFFTNQSEKVNY